MVTGPWGSIATFLYFRFWNFSTVLTKNKFPGGKFLNLSTVCPHLCYSSCLGSFGWWAAWLAGGDVVYLKEFNKPGSKLDRQEKQQDKYPESWYAVSGL